MPSKNQTQHLDELLGGVTEELLLGNPQQFEDNSIRVERLLLEMVRPDPVQPRRELPEQLHFAFHSNRLTPTQPLKELVQLVQVAARQRGRPFNNVLELLPNPNDKGDEEQSIHLSLEEQLLHDLVNLAITIRDDGQVNPLTVVDVSQGVTQQFRIETGERRYWATWLLRDFIAGYNSDGMVPCIIIPAERSSVFRQAKENTARSGLSAIAMARQAALLLLTVHGYEIPSHGVKDVNEWLQKGAAAEDALALLNKAESWLAAEVNRAAHLEGLARQDAIRELFTCANGLDNFALAEFKSLMARIGVKGRTFSETFKAAQSQKEKTEGEAMPEVLSDSIPILSPALGFRRDVAMVAVSVIERTRGNKLNTQPYLVTSTRKLHRLSDEQIITINNQEVALKVIPDGSEFLMRWRYSDIRRYLDGETIQPGAVFAAIHDLFKTYVDFRSDIESRLLTLWAIGTYFYTMFPAYPYLALNGPKNSGKSTVLRVLQPLAFNMITTSDPTGPRMFRLIHQTSCTVGIDEAERYHNPKDPGMQQIRQLLNSGYEQGVPAIRVTGDDLKPQAFDVYSLKILAAIMGLEDILASRCIAIPLRRTTRKMPSFPPDFDGAPLRHQLYTLALTHFQSVYTNYFERPELHKLHNRSGELWSPLVALAAFFEEQGGLVGLLNAISNAAEWDEQISEGKSLSDREEVVLQALEMMTHGQTEITWIKSSLLRERVAKLPAQPVEKLRDAQWIGHILKRLNLLDVAHRKRNMDGMTYAIEPVEIVDMMRHYDVVIIRESN